MLPDPEDEAIPLAELSGSFSLADGRGHQVHRFNVPDGCQGLRFTIRYEPKYLAPDLSADVIRTAVEARAGRLAASASDPALQHLVADWRDDYLRPLDAPGAQRRIGNLLTISLDDALGAYRGAGHRLAPEQTSWLRADAALPGLVPGPLPAGAWSLTVSAHALVTERVSYTIQIGALTARSEPSEASLPSA